MSDETTNDLITGRAVGAGRFELVRRLGEGGMGVVWLVLDRELNEHVAAKFLPRGIQSDPMALDDMRRETLKSRRLSHPCITRIHDFYHVGEELPFICMEYVNGQNLSELQVQQEGRVFRWDVLQPIVQQLCESLAYAHEEKIIHRDIKPGNLMLDSRGRLKLSDFGLSASASDSMSRLSKDMGGSGTPAYMSPQQLEGRPPKITDDIYALGATLYELLAGKPPFFTGDISHQILSVAPTPIHERLQERETQNEIPDEVDSLLMDCLSKEPDDRPQSAYEFAERLGLSLAGAAFMSRASVPISTSNIENVALEAEMSPPDTVYLNETEIEQTGVESEFGEVEAKPSRAKWIGGGLFVLIVVVFLVFKLTPDPVIKGGGSSGLSGGQNVPQMEGQLRFLIETRVGNYDHSSLEWEETGQWPGQSAHWRRDGDLIRATIRCQDLENGETRRAFLMIETPVKGDFVLSFQFFQAGPVIDGNFGVFYRSESFENSQRVFLNGRGIPLKAGGNGDMYMSRFGLITSGQSVRVLREVRPPEIEFVEQLPGPIPVISDEEFHSVTISVQGAVITHELDGHVVCRLEDPELLEGRDDGMIVFEIWADAGGEASADFRHIRLQTP